MKTLPVAENLPTVFGVFVIAVSFCTTSQMHFINIGCTALRNGQTASVRDITRAGVDVAKISEAITNVATMITLVSEVDTAKAATLTKTTPYSIKN